MNKLLSLILIPAFFTTQTLAQYWRSPNWQSFCSAQQDCAVYLLLSNQTLERYSKFGYPDEPSCRKLINCALINLQSWNETTGIKDYVFRYFFRAAPSDTDVQQRVQQCLQSTVPKPGEGGKYERAYRSFQCYYKNYAELVQEEQFVPFEHFELVKHRIESFAILNTSCHALREFSKGNLLGNQEFKDVLYTKMVRSGYYASDGDIFLDRWYKTFGTAGLLADSTRQCVANADQQYREDPERVYQMFLCLLDYVGSLQAFKEAATDVVVGANTTCNRCYPEPSCGCSSQPPPPPSTVTIEPLPVQYDTTLATSVGPPCYNGLCPAA